MKRMRSTAQQTIGILPEQERVLNARTDLAFPA